MERVVSLTKYVSGSNVVGVFDDLCGQNEVIEQAHVSNAEARDVECAIGAIDDNAKWQVYPGPWTIAYRHLSAVAKM
jgi:hypothetical protein